MDRFPKAPRLTIHDGVATARDYVEPLTALVQDEFNATFGVCPEFKVSPFGEK
jgi:hypothetical protein